MGRDYTRGQDYSDDVASRIDDEVRALINQAHEEAREIITAHRDALKRIAEVLVEKETIDQKEVEQIFFDVPKWEHDLEGSGRIRAPRRPTEPREGVAAASTVEGT